MKHCEILPHRDLSVTIKFYVIFVTLVFKILKKIIEAK